MNEETTFLSSINTESAISVDDSADIPVLDNPLKDPVSDLSADDITPDNPDFIEGIIVDHGDTVSTEKELVIINSSVPAQDVIIAELKPNQEVLILDEHNGLDQVQQYLDEHADTKYSAIHFVTHGNEGYISVNGAIIDADNVDAAEWAQIGEHLTDDGDILFYGCDTAKTTEGQQLMNTIAAASGADVAASTDATGIAGDWDLEYNVGIVEHEAISVESDNINLTNYNVTSNADDGSEGTLRWAITQANANLGTDEITFTGSQTITLTSDLTAITDSVSIIGNGPSDTVIDGTSAYRAFQIASNIDFNISLLQIKLTKTGAVHGLIEGGSAIYNNGGNIFIDECYIFNCYSSGYDERRCNL